MAKIMWSREHRRPAFHIDDSAPSKKQTQSYQTTALRNRNQVTNKTRLKVVHGNIDVDALSFDKDEEKARIVSTAICCRRSRHQETSTVVRHARSHARSHLLVPLAVTTPSPPQILLSFTPSVVTSLIVLAIVDTDTRTGSPPG
ncbi:hypothetical protein EV363DRAFT_1230434 [Boletus edulis]|uniref:Uncharacterized protein n=1 Tax=Boletus edulis BED1 TaxID=1328754 RepID=A0AAD4BRU7_BOLED|nr:hypothetical protein EV363DRAFT_1230434 [Boletus edulis]KAF8438555.1 hypothetical protein L210DRAFT_986709 [Boletus edulis BED1]